MAETNRAEEERSRTPAESLAFSVGNSVRWEILAALHTGERTQDELCQIVGLIPQTGRWHIKELEKSGCIELAETRLVRNAKQHIYRAIKPVEYTPDEFRKLSTTARQAHTKLILMSLTAEMFASWQTGLMLDDDLIYLVWDWAVQLDRRGREAWRAERDRHRKAKEEIQLESLDRLRESGEKPIAIVYGDLDFLRNGNVSDPPRQ